MRMVKLEVWHANIMWCSCFTVFPVFLYPELQLQDIFEGIKEWPSELDLVTSSGDIRQLEFLHIYWLVFRQLVCIDVRFKMCFLFTPEVTLGPLSPAACQVFFFFFLSSVFQSAMRNHITWCCLHAHLNNPINPEIWLDTFRFLRVYKSSDCWPPAASQSYSLSWFIISQGFSLEFV